MTSDELKTAATGFLPGVVVGAAVVWLVMGMTPSPAVPITLPSDTSDDTTASATTEAPAQTSPAPRSDAAVVADDQPAGRAVVIDEARLTATSWIAIRDYTDGKIGNVLGALRRDAGTHRDLVVDLLRSTEPGKEYAIVIFTDNGDNDFDTKTDTPVLAGTDPYRMIITATTPVAPNGR